MNAITWLVDRMHVSTSDRQVIREMYNRMKNNREYFTKEIRKDVYRRSLERLKQNQNIYDYVMKGR